MAIRLTKSQGSSVEYEEYPVSDHLRYWIAGFFRWSGSMPERILPNGQIDLVFSLDENPIDPNESRVDRGVLSLLYGELRQPSDGFGDGAVDLFGVSFFPWASETIVGLSAQEINGKVIPLQRLGRVDCERIRSMLVGCTTSLDRVRLIEEVFARIFPEPSDVEVALHNRWVDTWRSGGRIDEGDFDDLEISGSRFQKIFHRRTGMTSRQFCRLARFHAFLRRLEGGEKISTLAEDIGYYDQAHLTRECRDFSGVPPRQLHVELAAGRRVFKRAPVSV